MNGFDPTGTGCGPTLVGTAAPGGEPAGARGGERDRTDHSSAAKKTRGNEQASIEITMPTPGGWAYSTLLAVGNTDEVVT